MLQQKRSWEFLILRVYMAEKVTLKLLYDELKDFRSEMSGLYVTKQEFAPVRSVAYGMVGLILAGVLTAILAQVVKAAF